MSELGSLSQCLVDNDADARIRARRLRGKAFVLSIVLECVVLAALIVWPLFSPSVLATQYNSTPSPPYSGGKSPSNHPHSTPRPLTQQALLTICLAVCAPVTHPFSQPSDSEAPDIDQQDGENSGGQGLLPGISPGIPGSNGDRPVIPEPPRPETSRPPRVTKMSEGVMAAMLIHRVDPPYPAIARAAHISGTVHLHAIIGKDGTVRELEVVDGNVLLAQAAKAAVQNWRYRPTLLSGEAVEVDTYITVNFVLN
jgi:periplasmic protein TonB